MRMKEIIESTRMKTSGFGIKLMLILQMAIKKIKLFVNTSLHNQLIMRNHNNIFHSFFTL